MSLLGYSFMTVLRELVLRIIYVICITLLKNYDTLYIN